MCLISRCLTYKSISLLNYNIYYNNKYQNQTKPVQNQTNPNSQEIDNYTQETPSSSK